MTPSSIKPVRQLPELSVIIPVYNEQELIGLTLESLFSYMAKNYGLCEVVIVDDGSTDSTIEIVKQVDKPPTGKVAFRILLNEVNRGKGFSLRRGMLAAKGAVRIFIDADMPFELDAMTNIYHKVSTGCPIVVGARDLPGSTLVSVPFMRFLAGQIFSLLVQLFVFRGVRDTQCGLKGFDKKAATEVFKRTTIDDFGIDVELLFIARKLGFVIERVPVRMTGFRGDSRVNLLYDSIKMFLELLLIRWNDLRGLYAGGNGEQTSVS
ncbi:MAG TPA: glycosyltransferase [Anaerolineae bacterium]|nr:glycosyltransferase [Anaerolineae bacterium]